MSSPITLSVALVTRNRPESLERTLRSLRAQSVQPGEVVVSDDSDDGFVPAIADLSERYQCRHVIGPRNGLYANRNHAARQCQGAYIRTMDDDHEFPPGHFEACVAAIDSDPDAIWVIGERYPANSPDVPTCMPAELTARGYSRLPDDPDHCWAISCGASIYPRFLIDRDILNADYFKFGPLYLEYGSRLHWLGYRIRHLRGTHVIHHLDLATRSWLSQEIDLSSKLFATMCHTRLYQPSLRNRALAIAETLKLGLKHPRMTWRAWRVARQAYLRHRPLALRQQASNSRSD
jgi:glycosyltransferase involved in cell wall biosynthesis